jgi:8-oxo-dGTP pyrophosphatase MutT (NUDIX family)
MTSAIIHRVTALDLPVGPSDWPFAQARRAEIDAHFAKEQRDKPKLWNGRVLIGRNPVFADQQFRAECFETDFASFLAWRDWGFPDRDVFNGFGMGAPRSSDGAFVLGEMAQHTANAGRIYFPCGTPDPDDVRDGAVDVAGNVAREIFEETGLRGGAALGLRGVGRSDCDDPPLERRYARQSIARADRGRSRPPAPTRTLRNPSGAEHGRLYRGDAAFCHGLFSKRNACHLSTPSRKRSRISFSG